MIRLFGVSNLVDILLLYHEEYTKISLDYIQSLVAEHLGDYMLGKNEFNLNNLLACSEHLGKFLSDKNLQLTLLENLKSDCIQYCNGQKKAGRYLEDDITLVTEYEQQVEDKITQLPEHLLLQAIMTDFKEYNLELLTDIYKTDRIVDSLDPSGKRPFPDLNQMINMKEQKDKERFLNGDQMRMGKTAQPVLNKETGGFRLGLFIVPSNTINTHEGYLSDKVDPQTGKQIGYFKPGQAPVVLSVKKKADLERVIQEGTIGRYEYILISHERLTDDYVKLLSQLAEHVDFPVIDEIHKLKNIRKGKQAQNLLKLIAKIQGLDKLKKEDEDQEQTTEMIDINLNSEMQVSGEFDLCRLQEQQGVVIDDDQKHFLTLMSGTPIPNKVEDIAILLKLLHPHKFFHIDSTELVQQIINGDILDLRNLLIPYMQMKELRDSVDMPEIEYETCRYELSPREQEVYDLILENDELDSKEKIMLMRQLNLNSKLLQLEPVEKSSKVQVLENKLNEELATKDKVIVFVNDYVEGVIRGDGKIQDQLNLQTSAEFLTIDGSVTKGRSKIQNHFNQSSGKKILFVSGTTADVGIDLGGAETVIMYNTLWNNYNKKQQIARADEYNEDKQLKVISLIAKNTIEEGMEQYADKKETAIEKLLKGIRLTEWEKELLRKDETQVAGKELNKELADYYLSRWDKLNKVFGFTKELGSEQFKKLLKEYGPEYAECYTCTTNFSYQANANRFLSGVLVGMIQEQEQSLEDLRILDLASGPTMLKRKANETMKGKIISADLNREHFLPNVEGEDREQQAYVGNFLEAPIKSNSVDYATLNLAWPYTGFAPSRKQWERLDSLIEANRCLKTGSRLIINNIHSLKLKDKKKFAELMDLLGFTVVKKYTGDATAGDRYNSKIITLEKREDLEIDRDEITELMQEDKTLNEGLKFAKSKVTLKDQRKIVENYILNKQMVQIELNENDQRLQREEREAENICQSLISKY